MMLASLISNRTVVGTLAYLQWPPVHTIQWPTLILTLCYIYIYNAFSQHIKNVYYSNVNYSFNFNYNFENSYKTLKTAYILSKNFSQVVTSTLVQFLWLSVIWKSEKLRNKFYPEWSYYLRMIRILEKKEKEWNPRKRILAKAR